MRPEWRKRVGIAGVLVAFVAALLLLFRIADRPDAASDATTASRSSDSPSADGAGQPVPGSAAGESPELQQIDFGDMDARPWVYRDEAERLAAANAARQEAGPGGGPRPETTGQGIDSIDDVAPITGDGPLGSDSQAPQPSGLPGPGERQVGTERIGPAIAPGIDAGPGPEQGVIGRNSPGPARPAEAAQPEPARESQDPLAPGPGG